LQVFTRILYLPPLVAKAVRTEMLDIAESKPIHDLQTVLDASAVIIEEVERLKKENEHLRSVSIDLTAINTKLDILINASQPTPKKLTPAPHQTELNLGIEQRYKASQAALLAAKTLENEAKAQALTRKFAIKQKQDLASRVNTESIAAWASECIVLKPTAIAYIGNATGNPKTHLYPNYVNYCNQHHLELLNMQVFSRALMSLVEMTLEVRLSKSRDRIGSHLIGIAIAA